MECIKVDLPRDLKSVELHTLADLHLGDAHCDMSLVGERIRHIKETPNAYCILNGDLMNNATKTSVSDSYAERLTPMQQINEAVSLIEPIRHKVLAITSGNHELRTYRKEGIDLTEVMARELRLGEKFSPESALIFLRFGEFSKAESKGSGENRRVCYVIYGIHGTGGGRKEGAKAIRLADLAAIVDADIYIHSHTHLPMVFREAFFRTDTRNSSVAHVDKLFVNTGATLEYGGYGRRYEFKPSSKRSPVIYLSGTRKEFTAEL